MQKADNVSHYNKFDLLIAYFERKEIFSMSYVSYIPAQNLLTCWVQILLFLISNKINKYTTENWFLKFLVFRMGTFDYKITSLCCATVQNVIVYKLKLHLKGIKIVYKYFIKLSILQNMHRNVPFLQALLLIP